MSAHTLIEVIDKPSTCTERGVKHQECTICGYKSNAVEIDKLGHTLIDVPAKAASCQEDGNIAHRKCSRCGMLFDLTGNPIAEQDVIIPADPTMHVLKEIAAKTSTCTEHGNIVYYECSVCRAKFADKAMQDPLTDEDIELPLLPHSIDIKKWNADENYHWHECSVCGSRTDIKQHEFGPWIIQSTPTDKKDGLQTRTCSVCGYEQKQVKGKYDNEHPSTGDDSNIPLYLALIGASSVSAAAIALCYKKKVSRTR